MAFNGHNALDMARNGTIGDLRGAEEPEGLTLDAQGCWGYPIKPFLVSGFVGSVDLLCSLTTPCSLLVPLIARHTRAQQCRLSDGIKHDRDACNFEHQPFLLPSSPSFVLF